MAKTVSLKTADSFQNITETIKTSRRENVKENDKSENSFPDGQPENGTSATAVTYKSGILGAQSFEEYINGIVWEKNIEDQVFSDAQMVAKMFTDIIQEKSVCSEDNLPENNYFDFGETRKKCASVHEFPKPVFWNEFESVSTATTITSFSFTDDNSSECTTNDPAIQNETNSNLCNCQNHSSSVPNLKLGSLHSSKEGSVQELDIKAVKGNVKSHTTLETKNFRKYDCKIILQHASQENVNAGTCACNRNKCQAKGFRVHRFQNTTSLRLDLTSSSTTFATGSSLYGTLSSDSFVDVEDEGRKMYSPITILPAHNFSSTIGHPIQEKCRQEINNFHSKWF